MGTKTGRARDLAVMARRFEGASVETLAMEFGIAPSTIARILEDYAHLSPPPPAPRVEEEVFAGLPRFRVILGGRKHGPLYTSRDEAERAASRLAPPAERACMCCGRPIEDEGPGVRLCVDHRRWDEEGV